MLVYSKDGVAGNTSDGRDNNDGDTCVLLSVYIHSFVIRRQYLSDLIHFASFTNSYVGSYRGCVEKDQASSERDSDRHAELRALCMNFSKYILLLSILQEHHHC